MYRSYPLVALFALVSGIVAIPSPQHLARSILARAPAASNATINSITHTGTGCPSGSAVFIWDSSSDSVNSMATIAYDEMVAFSTADSVDQTTLSCVTTIDISLDPAWSYNVGNLTTFRGYMSLPEGTSLLVEAQYTLSDGTTTASFSVSGNAESTSTDYAGIVTGTSELTSDLGGGVLTIESRVDLNTGGDESTLVTLDTVDTTLYFVEAS